MDNNSTLAAFFTLVVVVAFSFIFSLQALYDANSLALILAFVGFIVGAAVTLAFGFALQQEGAALAIWFWVLLGVELIVLIWYTTRVGHAAGWL